MLYIYKICPVNIQKKFRILSGNILVKSMLIKKYISIKYSFINDMKIIAANFTKNPYGHINDLKLLLFK